MLYFTDIDECLDEKDNDCSMNATCTNIPGSYNCTCSTKFSGDGFNCERMSLERINLYVTIIALLQLFV